MKKEKIIKSTPLIVLLVATAYLLITVLTTDITLVKWHIVGLVFLGIATTAQMFNEKYGYWMTAMLLIFGTFSFAALTPWIFTFGIGPVQFDLLFLPTTILFIIVHRNEIPDWIHELRTDN
jgi:hypothetical protein